MSPDGTVYVAWRQYDFNPKKVNDAIVFVKSTDGGQTFSAPPGSQACEILDTSFATSVDSQSWSATLASELGHQPEYEMFGNRDIPFHGDYLWIDANGGSVYGVWTDNRDVVPGEDPREAAQDGFDVLQCRALQPDGTYGPDTCPGGTLR